MKESACRQAELTSIACLEKKRKLADEQQLEMPLPKQVCRGPSWDSSKEANKTGSDEVGESTNSNSFHTNLDSSMSIDDEAKTEIHTSGEPSTSSTSWACFSSLYSSGNTSSISTTSSEPESSSTNEHHVDVDVDVGHAEMKNYTDKELEDLLYSNGVAPGTSYILSSGRWSVKQDAEEVNKMTIDREFEQYFSMLML